jgi:hypothetical protein
MGQHDLSYRNFFADLQIIQDLLHEIVGERLVERIDLGSGERVDASFVSPKHENSESDVAWKFRRQDRDEPVYVYILLRFQWRPDLSIPIRLMAYESLLYQRVIVGQPVGSQKLPLVISVVAFLTGEMDDSTETCLSQFSYWLVDEASYPREELAAPNSPLADLSRIKKSCDWWEVRWSVHQLRRSIAQFEFSVRRAFETWLQKVILPRFGLSQEDVSAPLTLEELDSIVWPPQPPQPPS